VVLAPGEENVSLNDYSQLMADGGWRMADGEWRMAEVSPPGEA
jgi:hypothetical protein